MKTSIVLGTQYGDEGKGSMTSYLSHSDSLVVRFNGGHQAGHTVVKNGYRHVFSNLGAGTLNDSDTYWSEYCTFYPKAFFNEYQSLVNNKKIHSEFPSVKFHIHPLAMVTTPFDMLHNRDSEKHNNHGSVGLGFGSTINRNENTPFKLYAIDLIFRPVLECKLRNIANFYGNTSNAEKLISEFIEYTEMILPLLNINRLQDIKRLYSNIVFEGAQGIMLDMDFGYFPNVTRSNTTSKNAMKIISECDLPFPQVYYCLRSYLTRHGNGPMSNENTEFNFQDDTNKQHEYQGKFRQGYHSLEQLRYAIQCDRIFSKNLKEFNNTNLFITCLDQTDGKIMVGNTGIDLDYFLTMLPKMNDCFTNISPNVETIKLLM